MSLDLIYILKHETSSSPLPIRLCRKSTWENIWRSISSSGQSIYGRRLDLESRTLFFSDGTRLVRVKGVKIDGIIEFYLEGFEDYESIVPDEMLEAFSSAFDVDERSIHATLSYDKVNLQAGAINRSFALSEYM